MDNLRRELYQKLKETPVIYLARDIENATGIPLDTPGYFVVTNEKTGAKKLDTHELLADERTKKLIDTNPSAKILVFKNTPYLEKLAKRKGLGLINPSAELSHKIEEKITQVKWLGPLEELLPAHKLTTLDNLFWHNEPFVLQYNYGHSGQGTIFIESDRMLQ